nr:unnamed protein product [Digitaria exilis]
MAEEGPWSPAASRAVLPTHEQLWWALGVPGAVLASTKIGRRAMGRFVSAAARSGEEAELRQRRGGAASSG